MKTVKVGSVGLGRLGYEHAKNLATQVPGCELAAICDVDANRVKEVAAELGVPNTYTDFEEMCKNPELDAIVIVSPSLMSPLFSITVFLLPSRQVDGMSLIWTDLM